MEREGIQPGEKFNLKTSGNGLSVTVGTPNTKSDRKKTLKKLSLETIMEISNILNLSKRKTGLLCREIRSSFGKNSVESNLHQHMCKLHEELDEFYSIKEEHFESGDQEIRRDIVHIKDTSNLILHIIRERALDPHNTIARISVDSGQNMLKVVLNVFDPDEKETTSIHDDAGVKRSIILALVEDVPEKNNNLKKVLDPLRLEEVDYKLAFDLKAANAIFGLSAHSGKYACLYCDGECCLESGEKRTLGSIDRNFLAYTENGSNPATMKDFKNCISPRLVYLDEPEDTLLEHLVPPPELHIFIGIVTLFVKVLLSLWPGMEEWMKSNYILFRNYHGIGVDGNNANRFMKRLDQLQFDIFAAAQLEPILMSLVPVIDCLRIFQEIQQKSFGMTKGSNLQEDVERFKESFGKLQQILLSKFNYNLRVSWKVHILVNHLTPFLEKTPYGLGVFSEQSGESAHHHHNEVWKRFKRRIDHHDYGPQLKKSVVEYGLCNLK